MITLPTLLIICALVSAFLGAGGLNLGTSADGKARFTPNWVALALAFWFASMLVRG